MSEDLQALMALRVQGVASCERLAAALGCDDPIASKRGRELVGAGFASERTGRLAGFTLTPEGTKTLDEALADEGMRHASELHDAYERFLQLNRRLLAIASDWQVRRHGRVEEINDHSDFAYDAKVIGRLVDLHDRARVILHRMATVCERFGAYLDRLDACVVRLEDGDRDAFTAPMAESYHTVWFELHQDLLLTLGLEREE